MVSTPPEIPEADRLAIIAKAQETLWRRGDLSFLRHATQQKMHAAWREARGRQFFYLCSRRTGKSHNLCLTAIETCIQKPGAKVLYLAPQGSDAANIATDLIAKILATCPPDIRPEYSAQSKEYKFPVHGSLIRFKGTEGDHAKFLRGTEADLIIVDEAGLMADLKGTLVDVCIPMTALTNGRIIIATTPARSPSHYSTELYERLARQKAAAAFTIVDSVHIPEEVKTEMLVEQGEAEADARDIALGIKSPKTTAAKREFFCQFVTDAASAIVPEFDDEAQREIVTQHPIPDYRDCYVALDVGARDKTAIIFGYLDFVAGKLIIEDERLMTNPSTADIARTINEAEVMLWSQHGMRKEPYMRVSDIDLRLIQDLRSLYGLNVITARKDDSLGAVNLMRHVVAQRRIVINPRCTNLIRQLKNAIWNTQGTDMARAKEAGTMDAHYDLVAALKYLVRSVSWSRNPFPTGHFRPATESLGTSFGPTGAFIRRKNGDTTFLKRGATPIGKKLGGEGQPKDPWAPEPKPLGKKKR